MTKYLNGPSLYWGHSTSRTYVDQILLNFDSHPLKSTIVDIFTWLPLIIQGSLFSIASFFQAATRETELQTLADQARQLKDEVDILRETADKVEKYEASIESYKKKMEEQVK